MSPPQRRAEFWLALSRPMTMAIYAAAAVLGAVAAARPSVPKPFGVTGSIFFVTDGSLTYGLAAALFAGIAAGLTYAELSDVWQVAGVPRDLQVLRSVAVGALASILCRLFVIVGLMAGGLVDGASRGLTIGSTIPQSASAILRGQSRTLGAYLLAAAIGALIASGARRPVPALIAGGALTVPYLPVVGALANRLPDAFGVLPYGPFGALRAVLTGDGAIFGDDPTQARVVSALTAWLVIVAWLAALWLASSSVLRSRHYGFRGGYAATVTAALAGAGLIGGVVPQALGSSIPWQWRPSWRLAHAAGWDSRDVAQKWAAAVRSSGHQAAIYFASPGAARAVPPATVDVIAKSSSTTVTPIMAMHGPGALSILISIRPPIRGGNVSVDAAELQLRFQYLHGRWLITDVSSPAIHAVVNQ